MSTDEEQKELYGFYFQISLAIVLMMFAASVLDLSRPFWLDEAVVFYQLGEPNFWESVTNELHPPLFYLALVFVKKIAPITESGLRLFSVTCSFLTALVLIQTSRKRLKVLPISALLFLSSPMAVAYAQNLRPYALLTFISALLCYIVGKILFDKSNKVDLVFCTLLTYMGMMTHYWFVFLPAGMFCASLLIARRSRFKKIFYCFVVSGLLFVVTYGSIFLSHLGVDGAYYAGKVGFFGIISEGEEFLPGGKGKYPLLILVLVSIFRSRANLRLRFRNLKNSEPAFYFLSGAIAFLFPILLWVLKPVLIMKAVLVLVPPISLGLGYFIAKSLSKKELIAGMCMITAASLAFFVRNPISDKGPQTQQILSVVNESAANSTIVACELSYASTELYLSKYYPDLLPRLVSLPREIIQHRGYQPAASEIISGIYEGEIQELAKRDKLVVLYTSKDMLCNQLTDLLRSRNFREQELFSGLGDRFQKVLAFTKAS